MNKTSSYFNATRVSMIALFGALSAVLYVFGFSIPIFASWLELNFSDIPTLIGTFTLGPLSGGLIIGVKVVVKLLIKPTSTAFVGELADLLMGLALVVPAGIIYKKHRTFKGALVAMGVGSACSIAMAILANWLILIPFFSNVYSWNMLVGLMQKIFPACTQETFYGVYLWGSVLPFNALRCFIAVLATLLVYKQISRAINRLHQKLTPQGDENGQRARTLNLHFLIGFLVLLALVILFALLRYFLWK
jgi:riboflavin transporter FmnP